MDTPEAHSNGKEDLLTSEDMKELGVAILTFAASFMVKKALEKGYRKVYKKAPPDKRVEEDLAWLDLIGWTMVTGLAASATKIFIKRQRYRRKKY